MISVPSDAPAHDATTANRLLPLFASLLVLTSALALVSLHMPTAQAENGVVKDMTFLLHSVNATETAKPIPGGGSTLTYFDTTLDFNDMNVSVLVEGTQKVLQWFLVPALAGDFSTDGFTLRIWANSSTGASSNAQVTLEIYELNATVSNLIHEENLGSETFPVTPTLANWNAIFASPHTFLTGSSIELRMTVNPGVNNGIWFHYDTPQLNSRVSFHGPDSFDVAQIATLDSNRDPTTSFDPTAANKTLYVQALLTDPLGGYDLKWANATIIDPFGSVLVDNATMAKVSGTPLTFENLYEISWNYSGQPVGVYTVAIWAVDNNGHNLFFFFQQFTYGDFDVYKESSFSIGDFFFVNILVLDNASLPLVSAGVEARQLNLVIASATTNASGMVNLTLGSGTYDFVAIWQAVDAGVLTASITGNVTEDSPLVLQASVYYPTFRVLDSHLLPLSEAALTYQHPNGTTTVTPLITDAQGEVLLSQAAGGVYNVFVRWRGIEVAQVGVNVNESVAFSIQAAVYYVDFHVVDSQGADIESASVVVRDAISALVLDFQVTNVSGNATSRLPVGVGDVDVYVEDVLVFQLTGLVVDGDMAVELSSAIFYVDFQVVDSRSVPLEAAVIRFGIAQGVFKVAVSTDAGGSATVRVPNGTYEMSVAWQGTEVFSATGIDITGDRAMLTITSVYYVTFETRDSRNFSLADASVVVLDQRGDVANSGLTTADGRVELRLPASTYEINVTWKGHGVYLQPTFTVSGDATVQLPLNVYYYDITLVDFRSVSVREASLIVRDAAGAVLDSAATNDIGLATVRLPAGSFSLSATWRGVPVLQRSLSIVGDGSEVISAEVFYLTVRVLDREDKALTGVIVSVEPETPAVGTLLEFTGADGTSEFRLPPGQYTVNARLITTFQLSHIDVNATGQAAMTSQDQELILRLTEFEPPIYTTNAFLIGVIVAAVAAALGLYVVLRHRRPKEGAEAPEEEEARVVSIVSLEDDLEKAVDRLEDPTEELP